MRPRVIAAFVSLGCFGALSSPAIAGNDAWTTGDQEGGHPAGAALVGNAALVGTNSGGSGGGSFRSADGGATWQRIPGLDYKEVEGAAIDPAPGGPWYLATRSGMWRSLDGGGTWSEIAGTGSGSGDFFTGVSVDPGQPGTAFFLRFALDGGGVFRSTTGGAGSWTAVTGGLGTNNNLDGIVVDPVTHVAWGWRSTDGVWTLAPGATTWSPASVGLPSTSVRGLALDGSGSRRMIAATTSGMATLPAAGGPSWTPVNGGLIGGLETYATALTHDGGGAAYLETLAFHMWRLAPGTTTWTQVAAAGMPAPFADQLVGDPTQAGHVLALTASGFAPNLGLGPAWRTTDGGATFTRAGAGIRAAEVDAVAPDPRHAGRVLVGTSDDAIQRSQDSGGTWAPGATGLPDTAVRALGADGADDGTWYAAPGGGAGVYRSTDSGATWAAIGTGDPDNPFRLATIPGRAGVVFVSEGGTVYKSTNHGDTWTPLPALPGSVTSLVPDLAQAGAIWATSGNGGIWHIAEGEAAWTERDTGLGGLYVFSLAVDPHAPTRLFAALLNGGVYRSTDGGLTWAPMSNGIPDPSVNALAVDPQLADTVYAATQSGVYRSADAGASWAPVTGGITLPAVDSLAFDADGRTLYAGTQAIGVAARTRALPAPAGSAPRLVASPAISGTPRRGGKLAATSGTWDGDPAPALTLAWQRCTSASSCTAIGASGSSYTLKTADVGRLIRVHVTATNPSGSATADSSRTAKVSSKPVLTQKPAISGTPRVGRRIRPRSARFAASPAAKISRRWQRCPRRGGKCRAIRRATGPTYTPTGADFGKRLRLVVTASSSLGRTVASSARSAVVR